MEFGNKLNHDVRRISILIRNSDLITWPILSTFNREARKIQQLLFLTTLYIRLVSTERLIKFLIGNFTLITS